MIFSCTMKMKNAFLPAKRAHQMFIEPIYESSVGFTHIKGTAVRAVYPINHIISIIQFITIFKLKQGGYFLLEENHSDYNINTA